MSEVTTEDGREAFAAIDAMSRENDTSVCGGPWYAALRALTERDTGVDEWDAVPCARRLFRRHADADEREIRVVELHRRRSFVELFSDGNRPADLTDEEIASVASRKLEHRNGLRAPDGRALVERQACYVLGYFDGTLRMPLEKHRDVHRALCGEDYATRYERIKRDGGRITETFATEAQTGPTIRGCKWCVSGQ